MNGAELGMAIGTKVRKVKGYPFPGEVRSIFFNRAGELRLVVECTVPGVEGCLHIYSPDQVERTP